MGFSGIGIWEILLILIVALIVLGPRRLPEIARTIGKTLRAIKRASADLTTAVTRELETQDKPPQSQSAEKSKEAASATSKVNPPSQNDQPTKPEGQQQQNE